MSFTIWATPALPLPACAFGQATESPAVTVKIDGDTFTYDEDSVLKMKEFDDLFHHTDRNVLHRVAE